MAEQIILGGCTLIMAVFTILSYINSKKNSTTELSERLVKTEMQIKEHTKDITSNKNTIDKLLDNEKRITQLESATNTISRDIERIEKNIKEEFKKNNDLLNSILNNVIKNNQKQ